jgi:peroxiredoxin
MRHIALARLLVLVVLLALVVGGVIWLVTRKDEPEQPVAREHVRAPDFSLANSLGERLSLAETAGRPRILHFWASWTPYSRAELQTLRTLNEEQGDDITFIAISRDTDPSTARQFLRDLGLENEPWIVFDHQDTYYKELGGYNMPETVLIDASGGIVYHEHGPLKETRLRELITQTFTD